MDYAEDSCFVCFSGGGLQDKDVSKAKTLRRISSTNFW